MRIILLIFTLKVSLSQQTTASIASHFDLNFQETFEKLTTFFRYCGINHVFDISFARNIALLETAKEFIERKKNALQGKF